MAALVTGGADGITGAMAAARVAVVVGMAGAPVPNMANIRLLELGLLRR